MTSRLVRLLERRGHDAAAVCRSAGVSAHELSSPAARVPYRQADALLDACAELFGPHRLALELVSIVDDDTYDAAGLVLMTSETFGAGLERAFAYQRLWADGERFVLRRDASGAALRFRHPGPSPVARAVLAELAFLETMTAARRLVSPEARPVAVRFAHAPLSADVADLAAALGATPRFGEDDSELLFDAALLDAKIKVPEGALAHVHEVLAKRALDALPPTVSFAGRVRALCEADPNALSLGFDEIAERMRLARRTLQRRLAAEGTSWGELVDDLRRERAERLALQGATDKEISFLVGFADPSALARARARWRRRLGGA